MPAQLAFLSLLVRAISAYISRSGHLNRKGRAPLGARLFYCYFFAMLLLRIHLSKCVYLTQFNRDPADTTVLKA
jgi:hypothetical protein